MSAEPTEKETLETAAAILEAMRQHHLKLDMIMARITDLEDILHEMIAEEQELPEQEVEEEEDELPCSQPREVDFWIDREAAARSQRAMGQVPRAYPWNRKCEWTHK